MPNLLRSVKMLALAVLVMMACCGSEGRVLSKCELKSRLKEAFPKLQSVIHEDILAQFVCTVEHISWFNTSLQSIDNFNSVHLIPTLTRYGPNEIDLYGIKDIPVLQVMVEEQLNSEDKLLTEDNLDPEIRLTREAASGEGPNDDSSVSGSGKGTDDSSGSGSGDSSGSGSWSGEGSGSGSADQSGDSSGSGSGDSSGSGSWSGEGSGSGSADQSGDRSGGGSGDSSGSGSWSGEGSGTGSGDCSGSGSGSGEGSGTGSGDCSGSGSGSAEGSGSGSGNYYDQSERLKRTLRELSSTGNANRKIIDMSGDGSTEGSGNEWSEELGASSSNYEKRDIHKQEHVRDQEEIDEDDLFSSTLYGIFQLSDIACNSGTNSLNLCQLDCTALIDDDITDDIACLKILNEIGLSMAVNQQCLTVVPSDYFEECS